MRRRFGDQAPPPLRQTVKCPQITPPPSEPGGLTRKTATARSNKFEVLPPPPVMPSPAGTRILHNLPGICVDVWRGPNPPPQVDYETEEGGPCNTLQQILARVLSVFLVEPLTDTTSYAGATEVIGRRATVVRYNFLLSRALLACQRGGEGV